MRITVLMIGICVLVFILQSADIVGHDLAFMPATFSEKPYTIITSMFMHSGLYHLAMNMIGLLIFGLIVEEIFGKARWLVVYLCSGLFASLGYVLLSNSPFIYALGASGAIFGLMGAAAVLKPKQTIYVYYIPVPMAVAAMIWGGTELLLLGSFDNIAHSAHLFGLICGIALTFVYKKGISWKATLPLIIIVIAAIVLSTANLPKEIPDYHLSVNGCIESNISEINYKAHLYDCNTSIKLSRVSVAPSKFDMAYYAELLPAMAEGLYEPNYYEQCITNTTMLDQRNDSAFVSGTLCGSMFDATARICGNVEVVTIQISDKTNQLDVIDCTNLQ